MKTISSQLYNSASKMMWQQHYLISWDINGATNLKWKVGEKKGWAMLAKMKSWNGL